MAHLKQNTKQITIHKFLTHTHITIIIKALNTILLKLLIKAIYFFKNLLITTNNKNKIHQKIIPTISFHDILTP
jgi:hypothetical protein